MNVYKLLRFLKLGLLPILLFLFTNNAYGIPSFARQTNLPCSACHTIFPELNSFGRLFKLNGYTMTGIETIQAQSDSDNTTLSLRKISPVSAMIQMAYTYKSKAEPTTQNGNASFPQQLSLFLGGEITPKIGGFVQVTYADQDGGFGLDNSDLRYANQTELADQDLIYGVTINNNPTVQDLWNSTPAWGFPYASSSTAPTPAAATLIEGGLAQNVAGLGLYSLWDNLLYTEISVYRSAQQGAPNPPDNTSEGVISSLAPYWRLALQKQFDDYYVELGTYGMHTNEYLNGTQGLTDKYTDIGFDLNVEKQRCVQ